MRYYEVFVVTINCVKFVFLLTTRFLYFMINLTGLKYITERHVFYQLPTIQNSSEKK